MMNEQEFEPLQGDEAAQTTETSEVVAFKTDEQVEQKPKNKKQEPIRNLYDWLEVVVCATVIVVFIFTFVGRLATVSGTSMTNTLNHGERLIVTSLFYEPKRYDIVVVQKRDGYFRDELIIKRVIAKGGETITFDFTNWVIYIDGRVMSEPYVKKMLGAMNRENIVGNTVTVPDGCYFVMGDNRNGSTDSRSSLVGFVRRDEIVGHAIFRVYPFDRFGSLNLVSALRGN